VIINLRQKVSVMLLKKLKVLLKLKFKNFLSLFRSTRLIKIDF